jgi:hypothetical protein
MISRDFGTHVFLLMQLFEVFGMQDYFFVWFVLRFAFCFMGLDSYVIASESYFGLHMVYHLRYFHVMFFMCDDNDSHRH